MPFSCAFVSLYLSVATGLYILRQHNTQQRVRAANEMRAKIIGKVQKIENHSMANFTCTFYGSYFINTFYSKHSCIVGFDSSLQLTVNVRCQSHTHFCFVAMEKVWYWKIPGKFHFIQDFFQLTLFFMWLFKAFFNFKESRLG